LSYNILQHHTIIMIVIRRYVLQYRFPNVLVHTFRMFHRYGARKQHLAPEAFRDGRHMWRDLPVFQRLLKSRPYRERYQNYQNRRRDKRDVVQVEFKHDVQVYRIVVSGLALNRVTFAGLTSHGFRENPRERRRRLTRV